MLWRKILQANLSSSIVFTKSFVVKTKFDSKLLYYITFSYIIGDKGLKLCGFVFPGVYY